MTTAHTKLPHTLRILLSGLIDYAGLFPPATLNMPKTAQNYARDGMGEFHWALGRLVCPASRLEELTEHARILMPGSHAFSGYVEQPDRSEPWSISVVMDTPLSDGLDLIDDFNSRHAEADHGLAKVDTLEMRVTTPSDIDTALDQIHDDILPFFELPVLPVGEDHTGGGIDLRGFIAALAGHEGAAKIRCGGVEARMIPSVERVAEFIHLCAQGDVRFKATAGLHHPIRAEQPLTYEPDPPRAVMHGFVNLFLAAAFARTARADRGLLESILSETDPTAFAFSEKTARWRDRELDTVAMSKTRESFALSYGSCSFTEPIDDVRALGWI